MAVEGLVMLALWFDVLPREESKILEASGRTVWQVPVYVAQPERIVPPFPFDRSLLADSTDSRTLLTTHECSEQQSAELHIQ